MSQVPQSGPVLFDLDHAPAAAPGNAPPVPDVLGAGRQTAMQNLAMLTGRGRPASRLGRWFWATAGALVSFLVSLAAYNYVVSLLAFHMVPRPAVSTLVRRALTGLFDTKTE